MVIPFASPLLSSYIFSSTLPTLKDAKTDRKVVALKELPGWRTVEGAETQPQGDGGSAHTAIFLNLDRNSDLRRSHLFRADVSHRRCLKRCLQ